MNRLKTELITVTQTELKEANEKFGLFTSQHEAAAVIQEEMEETEDALKELKILYMELWLNTKRNNVVEKQITQLHDVAIQVAAEAIQVAAMAQKYLMSDIMPYSKE